MRRHLLSASLLVILMLCTAGCGAVAVGTTQSAMADAQTSVASYNAPLSDTFEATLAACQELGILVTDQKQEENTITVWGNSSGELMVVTLKRLDSDITQIDVQIGFIADKETARALQDAISSKL